MTERQPARRTPRGWRWADLRGDGRLLGTAAPLAGVVTIVAAALAIA